MRRCTRQKAGAANYQKQIIVHLIASMIFLFSAKVAIIFIALMPLSLRHHAPFLPDMMRRSH